MEILRPEISELKFSFSLDIKFIGSSSIGDEIVGDVEIQKVTNSLVFMRCKLSCKKLIIAIGTGVWKKTKKSFN